MRFKVGATHEGSLNVERTLKGLKVLDSSLEASKE